MDRWTHRQESYRFQTGNCRTAEAEISRLLGAVGHQFQTEAMQWVQASLKGGSCQDVDWQGVKEPVRGLQGGGTWPQKPEQGCSHCAVC